MSPVIDLKVTYTDGSLKALDRLVIRRLTGLWNPIHADNEVHTYEAFTTNWHTTPVQLEHRYGDGAWVLVQKALGAIHESDVQTE